MGDFGGGSYLSLGLWCVLVDNLSPKLATALLVVLSLMLGGSVGGQILGINAALRGVWYLAGRRGRIDSCQLTRFRNSQQRLKNHTKGWWESVRSLSILFRSTTT